MKVTIVGDPHVTQKSIPLMEKVFDQIENLGHPVIFLGDQLDTKSIISGKCLNFWLDYFKRSKLKHVLLTGNHDYFSALECKDHALRSFSDLFNVVVIDRTQQIVEGMPFYGMPYMTEKDFKSELKKVPTNAVLFCHADISGFDYGTGLIHKGDITLKNFRRFKRVISGHYHKYQIKGNLTYLGTPYSKNFGETDQTKYIAIYDSEKDDFELIETDLPQHCTIEIDCDLGKQSFKALELNKRDIYRFILRGTQSNITNFPVDEIQDNHPSNIIFIKRPDDQDESEFSITELDSPEKQFEKWGVLKKMPSDTLKLGLTILETVKCL